MKDCDASFADKVCKIYDECGTIRGCVRVLGCSWGRIIKILSTRGYILNDNHALILKLQSEGMDIEYISKQTGLSEQTVRTYLPASRPFYGIKQSANAVRIKNWRAKKAEGLEKSPHTDG